MEKSNSYWQTIAKKRFNQYEMNSLPPSLRRNNLEYYYLGIYPPLTQMKYVKDLKVLKYPKEINSLYVHIPFCVNCCEFCSYYKITINLRNKVEIFKDYFNLLKKELLFHANFSKLKISYIYFGGGTPSLVPADILADFLQFLRNNNFLKNKIYGSLEIHPNLFKKMNEAELLLSVLKSNGLNRVSLGYQFDSPKLMEIYQRKNEKDNLHLAIDLIKKKDMLFNIDLMYGLPNQSLKNWEDTLKTVTELKPESISVYFAFADKHTLFRQKIENGKLKKLSHQEIQTQQILAQLFLEELGFQELPSNFFNQVNYNYQEIRPIELPSKAISLAIGPGTYSFFDNTQFINYFDLNIYREKIEKNQSPIWRAYQFNDKEMIYRDLMFLIKNSLSIDIEQLIERYKINPLFDKKTVVIFNILFKLQLIRNDKNIIKLTSKGRLIADEIAFLFKVPHLSSRGIFSEKDKKILEKYNFGLSYPDLV